MLISRVLVRFYKSFNFDYLRKHLAGAQPDPWEGVDGSWYPYVQVPVDPKVTTAVGANVQKVRARTRSLQNYPRMEKRLFTDIIREPILLLLSS